MAKRTIMAAGNWKMNKTPAEAVAFVEGLKPLVTAATTEVVVGVPSVALAGVTAAAKGSNIKVAAQKNTLASDIELTQPQVDDLATRLSGLAKQFLSQAGSSDLNEAALPGLKSAPSAAPHVRGCGR